MLVRDWDERGRRTVICRPVYTGPLTSAFPTQRILHHEMHTSRPALASFHHAESEAETRQHSKTGRANGDEAEFAIAIGKVGRNV